MKSKKKILSVFYGSLQIYTRYSWVADEEQKKKVLGVSNGSYLRSFVGQGNSLFDF